MGYFKNFANYKYQPFNVHNSDQPQNTELAQEAEQYLVEWEQHRDESRKVRLEAIRRVRKEQERLRRKIYFVQEPEFGLIKIGFTTRIKARTQELKSASKDENLVLLGTIQGDVADEKAIHKMFTAFKSHKEWFHPAPPVLFFIKRIVGNGEIEYL